MTLLFCAEFMVEISHRASAGKIAELLTMKKQLAVTIIFAFIPAGLVRLLLLK